MDLFSPAPTIIYVCVNCRSAGEAPEPKGARAGARLHAAMVETARVDPTVEVRAVECLSVCKRPVTVALAGGTKWSYLYGDFTPDDAEMLLASARAYSAAPDGLIPWKERHEKLKRGVVARLPPLP